MASAKGGTGRHPVDRHVGSRLRLRRGYLELSQDSLGRSLGCSYQQIQKYENGSNRIPASRLFELAVLLDVPVDFFFEGLDPGHRAPATLAGKGDVPAWRQSRSPGAPMMRQDLIDLIEEYDRLPDPKVRRDLLTLVRILARTIR